ncbi:hypothetical protein GCM10023237_39610 [Streptomyces coeruleoprunus]
MVPPTPPAGGEPRTHGTGVDRGSRAQDWRCWDASRSWARASQSEHVTPGPPPDPPTVVVRGASVVSGDSFPTPPLPESGALPPNPRSSNAGGADVGPEPSVTRG